MPAWPPTLALLLTLLWFAGRLPALGSPSEMLLAAVLAVATVAVVLAGLDRLRATTPADVDPSAPLLAETDA